MKSDDSDLLRLQLNQIGTIFRSINLACFFMTNRLLKRKRRIPISILFLVNSIHIGSVPLAQELLDGMHVDVLSHSLHLLKLEVIEKEILQFGVVDISEMLVPKHIFHIRSVVCASMVLIEMMEGES